MWNKQIFHAPTVSNHSQCISVRLTQAQEFSGSQNLYILISGSFKPFEQDFLLFVNSHSHVCLHNNMSSVQRHADCKVTKLSLDSKTLPTTNTVPCFIYSLHVLSIYNQFQEVFFYQDSLHIKICYTSAVRYPQVQQIRIICFWQPSKIWVWEVFILVSHHESAYLRISVSFYLVCNACC